VANLDIGRIEECLNKVVAQCDRSIICEVSGGEPTLSSNFIDVLKLLKRYKEKGDIFKIAVLTNAITSSDANFAREISRYADDAVVSLYSHNAEQHDWFTGISGSFAKKTAGINNLLNNGVYVHIKTLVMKPSFKDFEQLAIFIRDNWGRIIHATINATHYTGDALKNSDALAVKYSEAKPYLEKALDVFMNANITTNIFLPICILDPKYWHLAVSNYVELINNSHSIAPNMEFGKAGRLLHEFINCNDFCKKCELAKRCNWPWRNYEGLFGFKEIETAYSSILFKGGEK
jgi:MoaA/NifB/PqqE/SkfB family radical SAM enzyme